MSQLNGNAPTSDGEAMVDGEHGAKTVRRRKSVWRNIIENFTSTWFAIVMNTGILGILYQNQPYTFDGLKIISTIMYVFAIVLFILCAIPTIIRWTCFPEEAAKRTRGNLEEMGMIACQPIAWFELTSLTALIASTTSWGGHGFSILAVVMWWFGTVWMVAVCFGVVINAFAHDITSDRTIVTQLFVPAVGVATNAVTGAIICRYGYDVSARLAVPILIMSYLLDGLAIFLALYIYTVYFHRLLVVGWPVPAKLPSLVLLVGPFGQTAAALLLTGSAASTRMDFAHYDRGTFLTMMGGQTVSAAGVLIALLLLGHDLFWLVVALYGIIQGALRRELSYNLSWWATIFPIGTTTTCFLALSIDLDSPTFRALTAIFTILLTIDYLINWPFTIWYSIKGDLLVKSEDYDEVEKVD